MENKILEPQRTRQEDTDQAQMITYKANELPEIYKPLLFSNFLLSLKSGNDLFMRTDRDTYFKYYHAFIESLLERKTSKIKLAVLAREKELVFGWALMEPNILHYIFVPKIYRNNGISKLLLKGEEFETISHVTKDGEKIFSKKTFNPWT